MIVEVNSKLLFEKIAETIVNTIKTINTFKNTAFFILKY